MVVDIELLRISMLMHKDGYIYFHVALRGKGACCKNIHDALSDVGFNGNRTMVLFILRDELDKIDLERELRNEKN